MASFSRRDHRGPHTGRAWRRNTSVSSRVARESHQKSRRHALPRVERVPFSPPEDWHEPTGEACGFRVVVQTPGEGYRHVLTPDDVRGRLADLPTDFLRDLEVVQLSRMTRKKLSLPCYGMQWGPALYLYPIDESLIEHFGAAPTPNIYNEAKMFGGVWSEAGGGAWTLTWTEETIRDFYLNNILIHELGHLLDDRNTSYVDRERYAEWFAIEYGYRRTGGADARRPERPVTRRHDAGAASWTRR